MSDRLRRELEERQACLVGARQTMEAVAATIANADDIELVRGALTTPVDERIALLAQAIENTEQALYEDAQASIVEARRSAQRNEGNIVI